MNTATEPFLSLEVLAARLGLPLVWLRREADARHVPFLRVGRRRVFLASEVAKALAARAAGPKPEEASDGR